MGKTNKKKECPVCGEELTEENIPAHLLKEYREKGAMWCEQCRDFYSTK